MTEGSRGPRLLLEATEPFRVVRGSRRQDLDRDLAGEHSVPAAVDLAHPARSERAADLVPS
jgi:hypothetical protein